jgi:hypothetical protein
VEGAGAGLFGNLLGMAWQAMPKNGKVTLCKAKDQLNGMKTECNQHSRQREVTLSAGRCGNCLSGTAVVRANNNSIRNHNIARETELFI